MKHPDNDSQQDSAGSAFNAETTIPPKSPSDFARSAERLTRATPPPEFEDYELLEEIARGGMGIVYRAQQKSLDRIVALKTVLAGHLASDEEIQLFHTEARAAGKLNHPGIVPVYDVGESQGFHYFSMPLIDGDSLADRIVRRPLHPDEAARIIKDAAETVHFAHQNGVVHRDLKPGNILIDDAGQPLITDFGIARRIDDGGSQVEADALMGTAEYMAPEQASGETVGPPADVYSLGATLYCLLTGHPPFQSPNPLDTLVAVLERDPVPPRRLNERIPRDLELVCMKCLEKRPAARYATAEEVAQELDRFLKGDPVLVHPVGNIGAFLRWTRRQPRAAAMATGLVVSFTAALGISVYYNFQLQRQKQIAVLLRRSAELSEESAQSMVKLMESLVSQNSTGQPELAGALQYSRLGSLCAAAADLGRSRSQLERDRRLDSLHTAVNDLELAEDSPLLQPIAEIESTIDSGDSDAELLQSAADEIIETCRSVWHASTESAPRLQQQIRSVLYARAIQLGQEIQQSPGRFDASQFVESLQNLLRGELTVTATDDVLQLLRQTSDDLQEWLHGAPPASLGELLQLLDQATDRQTNGRPTP